MVAIRHFEGGVGQLLAGVLTGSYRCASELIILRCWRIAKEHGRDCAQFCAHHQTLPSATAGRRVRRNLSATLYLYDSVAIGNNSCNLLILRAERLRRQTLYPAELRARRADLLILKHFSIPQLPISSILGRKCAKTVPKPF